MVAEIGLLKTVVPDTMFLLESTRFTSWVYRLNNMNVGEKKTKQKMPFLIVLCHDYGMGCIKLHFEK